MRLWSSAVLAAVLFVATTAEDFGIPDPPEDGQPDPQQSWPPDKPSSWVQHKPKARAGVLVARYVPQSKMPQGTVLGFANITYRIVGADMTTKNIQARYDQFELVFKKLYGGANLHSKILHLRPAEAAAGTVERPCPGDFDSCCLHKGPVADPETWSAIDVTLEVGCSRESLWPDQGSVDWAHARMLGTHLHTIGISGRTALMKSGPIPLIFWRAFCMLLLRCPSGCGVRCLLQRADVLSEGVHAHKYLPITALYSEETTLQFTGHSLSQWLPLDVATQNLILHSMDLIGLNRIAGCARIRITKVSQWCLWVPGRGQIGIANMTLVTHREYPDMTLPMALEKTLHILLERLNEEGLNLAKIEVVSNHIVKGPEWGNMHDQIESMLAEDDPIRTYETRVPVEQLPNFRKPKGPLTVGLFSLAATVVALAAGAVCVVRKRGAKQQGADLPGAYSYWGSVGMGSLPPGLLIPSRDGFKRRDSAPATQGPRDGLERTMPHLPRSVTHGPGTMTTTHMLQSARQAFAERLEEPQDAFFYDMMRGARLTEQHGGISRTESESTTPEMASGSSSQHIAQPWISTSSDSPNPFALHAAIPTRCDDSDRSQNFGTVPAATVIQQGSLQDTATEQQREEQLLRSQKLRERGATLLHQLEKTDNVASWLLNDEEVEICLKQDGKRWMLGAGAYGKVYKGLRGGVQDVAVKVLHTADELQMSQFCLEIKLLKSLSFDRNIVQFLGACLHSGSPMLVLEFMEGGDLRQALSSPVAVKYHWNDLGQRVALDIVRGLYFLHRNKVVHSDLKSRNVLLGRDGITAKLSDVGMSRILSGSRSGLTGEIPGTFPYAAPELLLGLSCTVKADIFSLGVLFWEICTKEIPVRGSMRELRVPEECSELVKSLIHDCQHADPTQRPSAREIFDRIREDTAAQVARVPSLASSAELGTRASESQLRQGTS